jgi:hypothetical protein
MFIIAALTFAAACGIMVGTWWNWIAGIVVGISLFIFLARIGEQREHVFLWWLIGIVVGGGLGYLVDCRLGIILGTVLYGILSMVSKKTPVAHRGSYGSQANV